MNKKWGLLFLIISIILLAAPSMNITGNAIAEKFSNISYFYLLGLAFLFISFIIFTSKQSLDAIIIPTGPSTEVGKERADRAVKEYQKRKARVLIISGRDNSTRDSQRYAIYSELRKYGIKPSQIRVEGEARDSIENILHTLIRIKSQGARDIGIASNPSHLDRFETIIEKGKEEGIIEKDFKVHRLETKETLGESVYGFFANLFNRYKLRNGIENARNYQAPKWVKFLGGYIFNLSSKK